MRRVLLVISLAIVATALVHLRREEARVRYETYRCQARQVALRRELWDQQVLLGERTSPGRIRRTAEAMALGLAERTYVSGLGASPGGEVAQRPR